MTAFRRLKVAPLRWLPTRRIAHGLISRANQARDLGRFAEAAPLYEEALRLLPNLGGIHVQAGHMRKEIGDFDAALIHYHNAQKLMPNDADLALQLGHFFNRTGRHVEAVDAYRKALRLDPQASDAIKAIEALGRSARLTAFGYSEHAEASWEQAIRAGLVPELLPEHSIPATKERDRIVLKRAGGRPETGPWGDHPTIHGVGAVRGYLISRERFDTLTISLDGHSITTERPSHRLLPDDSVEHIFNAWIDTAGHEPGLRRLSISFAKGDLPGPSKELPVVVVNGVQEAAALERDDIIAPAQGGRAELDNWIRSLPSEVRSVRPPAAPLSPRTILVLRMDQLGDLVVSVPALKRLRELTDGAKLIGLLTPANAELATSLNLFDEVLVANFPISAVSHERVMSASDQAALRQLLQSYAFDAAIDLGTSHMSRPLLLLSGAPRIFGFKTDRWKWLDEQLSSPVLPAEERVCPHSERMIQMVEHFATAVGATVARPVIPRNNDDASRLATLGLSARAYIVLHETIRHEHNRWPGFAELLNLLLAATPLDIAFLTDSPNRFAELTTLAQRERVRLFDRRLAFDDLDALLGNAAAYAGVDSGPKHLAALRGVPVVSIHASRSDWREWGQEQTGLIVSRRLPCAGCGIGYDDDACGKDVACIIDIRPEEVCSCVLSLLAYDDDKRAR